MNVCQLIPQAICIFFLFVSVSGLSFCKKFLQYFICSLHYFKLRTQNSLWTQSLHWFVYIPYFVNILPGLLIFMTIVIVPSVLNGKASLFNAGQSGTKTCARHQAEPIEMSCTPLLMNAVL